MEELVAFIPERHENEKRTIPNDLSDVFFPEHF